LVAAVVVATAATNSPRLKSFKPPLSTIGISREKTARILDTTSNAVDTQRAVDHLARRPTGRME